MDPKRSPAYRYSRLVALGASAFLGVGVVLGLGAGIELAAVFVEPLVATVLVCWGAHYAVYWWARLEKERVALALVQGPGEELLHKAGLVLFRAQEGEGLGDEAEAAFIKGERFYFFQRFRQAAEQYSASLEAGASLPAYLNLGAALLVLGEFERAEENLDLGLRLSRRREDPLFEAAFCGNLGVLRGRQGDTDAAAALLAEGRDCFARLGEEAGREGLSLNLGIIHANRGAWRQARPLFERAAAHFGKNGPELGYACALGNLGNALAEAGVEAAAQKHYRQALRLHEGRDNSIGRANILSNLGNQCLRRQEMEQALEYYRQALELHRQVGGPLGEAAVLGNVGSVRFRRGEYEEALEEYQAALELHRSSGNRLGQARTLTNIGSLNARRGAGRDSVEALEQAQAIYTELGTSGRAPEAVGRLLARVRRRLDS